MVNNILRYLRRFFRAQEAVSALEYAILVGVIVAGVGAALLVFSDNVEEAIGAIGTKGETTAKTADTGSLADGNKPSQ